MVEQNTEIAELNLEELYTTYTSDEQIKESYERRTVPTGRYTYNPEEGRCPAHAGELALPGPQDWQLLRPVDGRPGRPEGLARVRR